MRETKPCFCGARCYSGFALLRHVTVRHTTHFLSLTPACHHGHDNFREKAVRCCFDFIPWPPIAWQSRFAGEPRWSRSTRQKEAMQAAAASTTESSEDADYETVDKLEVGVFWVSSESFYTFASVIARCPVVVDENCWLRKLPPKSVLGRFPPAHSLVASMRPTSRS